MIIIKNPSFFRITTERIIIVLILLLSFSCASESDLARPDNLIPEKKLTAILTEAYLADGLLSLPTIRDKYLTKDSLDLYKQIIEKYGYSKEEMDLSLEYYFVKKQNRLIKIYDNVIAELRKMEEATMITVEEPERPRLNLWKGMEVYNIPDSSGMPATGFSFRITPPGSFILTYTITVFPSDESGNPYPICWIVRADSTENGQKRYLPLMRYFADGVERTYTITGEVDGMEPLMVKGSLFSTGSNPDLMPSSAVIGNISFSFSRHVL